MAPARSQKRVSGPNTAIKRAARFDAIASQTPTPAANQSPSKKTRQGIAPAQKQALIENLQLEVTERARRLRSQYNLQAQGLRSRVEIRVNRIPTTLRRLKMSDLLRKLAEQQARVASKPPPLPAKDVYARAPSPQKGPAPSLQAATRSVKRKSGHMTGSDKENDTAADSPTKRIRPAAYESVGIVPIRVLSPASSNTRIAPRIPDGKPALPPKTQASRPASPAKLAVSQTPTAGRAATILSNMVEKAKAGRGATARKPTEPVAVTSSVVPSSSAAAAPRSKAARKGPTPQQVQRSVSGKGAASRTGRRVSDSSDTSTSTVVRKTLASGRGTAAPPSSTTKRSMMGSFKKGVSAASKKPAVPRATTASAGSTRVLRRRA